jgi:hypothetical protein
VSKAKDHLRQLQSLADRLAALGQQHRANESGSALKP